MLVLTKQKVHIFKNVKLHLNFQRKKKTIITFGNEKILANEDLTLKYSRNISIYYSQLCGVQFKDLGRALRKVNGSAVVSKDQFKRLCEIISIGNALTLFVEGQEFKAILTSLEKKSKNEIYFNFLEVA